MPIDGISRLIAITQTKSSNANDQIFDGADKQRQLVKKSQTVHAVQRSFGELARTEQQSAVMELQTKLTAFRKTLSGPAAALLDQWLEWAAQRR